MIKWAKNFGHIILMEQWENITRVEIYINLKVNFDKMMLVYDSRKIVRMFKST